MENQLVFVPYFEEQGLFMPGFFGRLRPTNTIKNLVTAGNYHISLAKQGGFSYPATCVANCPVSATSVMSDEFGAVILSSTLDIQI